MPIGYSGKTWADANAYCNNTAINEQTGWRLPTAEELSALYDSGAMKRQGWTLDSTWSSTLYGSHYHYEVSLDYGFVDWNTDKGVNHVTCVHGVAKSVQTKQK